MWLFSHDEKQTNPLQLDDGYIGILRPVSITPKLWRSNSDVSPYIIDSSQINSFVCHSLYRHWKFPSNCSISLQIIIGYDSGAAGRSAWVWVWIYSFRSSIPMMKVLRPCRSNYAKHWSDGSEHSLPVKMCSLCCWKK